MSEPTKDEILEYVQRILLALRYHQRLVDALREVSPYMEAAEEAGLVGDEGCHWPVENVRTLLAEIDKEAANGA